MRKSSTWVTKIHNFFFAFWPNFQISPIFPEKDFSAFNVFPVPRETSYLQHGVGIGVVVGKIADISVMFKVEREGGGVVGLAACPSCGTCTPYKVVLVVTNLCTCPDPVRPAPHGFSYGEHHRTHTLRGRESCTFIIIVINVR